jgi:endonuclease YncB( thermonuclease family)
MVTWLIGHSCAPGETATVAGHLRARWSRHGIGAAFFLSIAFASPAVAQESLILCASPGITDGDTFRCDGNLKIRLWGVDSPERATPAGPAATRALADITYGETLVCKRRGKSYDRIVAQCWIGNRDVAAEMVRRGQAVDMPKFSKGLYAKGTR